MVDRAESQIVFALLRELAVTLDEAALHVGVALELHRRERVDRIRGSDALVCGLDSARAKRRSLSAGVHGRASFVRSSISRRSSGRRRAIPWE
jgi:hypothetical protein